MIYPYPTDRLTWPAESWLVDAALNYQHKGLLSHCLMMLAPDTALTIGRLSRESGLSYGRVQRDMRRLQECGYAVKRAGRQGHGRWGSTHFDLYAIPAPLYHRLMDGTEAVSSRMAIVNKRVISSPNGHNDQTGDPNGAIPQTGESRWRAIYSNTYGQLGHPFGGYGQTFSLSSSLDLKKREKEAHPNGTMGQTGNPCTYDPVFACPHYRAALQAIQTVLQEPYPHFRVQSVTHVHAEVFDTVHRPEFSLPAITLIYRYLVDKEEKLEWLYPNKVLSCRARDDKLAQAQAWMARQKERSTPECLHMDWQAKAGRFVCLACGQDMGESADALDIQTFIEQRWGTPAETGEGKPDAC